MADQDEVTLQEQYAMAKRAKWILQFMGATWTYIGLVFLINFSLLTFIIFPVSLYLVLSRLKDIQDNNEIQAELLERMQARSD